MKDLDNIKPTTVTGIKTLAKQIKKVEGISLNQAQNIAAKQAGYENFTHARRALSDQLAH